MKKEYSLKQASKHILSSFCAHMHSTTTTHKHFIRILFSAEVDHPSKYSLISDGLFNPNTLHSIHKKLPQYDRRNQRFDYSNEHF